MGNRREFNNILDECLERLLVKGDTITRCLQSYPKYADELRPLLETALATRRAVAISPRPGFKERARYEFSLALQEAGTPKRRPFPGWKWQVRWLPVVAIILTLLVAGSGTVVAASDSVPSSPLYPVKLATEQVRLAFTPSALGKAEYYAELADKRVNEMVLMAGRNKPEQIEQTTRRLNAYLTRLSGLTSNQEVAGVAMAQNTVESAGSQETMAVEEEAALEALPEAEEAAPDTGRPETENARMFNKAPEPAAKAEAALAEEAPLLAELEEGAGEKETGADRRARLKKTIGQHAINHPARLRALLQKVPQSARPALLRAIAISEMGYEKALHSFDR